MSLNKELVDILVCPKCKGGLELLSGETGLKCDACKVIYPIKDEIPIMLADEAVPADKWENK